MKRLVFLLVVLVSLNASGQRFFDYRTQNTSTQAQAKLRQIELNVLLDSLKNSRRLSIDTTFHKTDSTRLDSIAVDSMAVDTLPWFKPYIRKRLPHGVD